MAEEPYIHPAYLSEYRAQGEKAWHHRLWQYWPGRGGDGTRVRFGSSDCGPAWLQRANPSRSSSDKRAVPASRCDHFALSVNAADKKSYQRGNPVADET